MITRYGTDYLLTELCKRTESYVGLSATKPDVDGGNVTEPSAQSYERQLLCNVSGSTKFGTNTPTENGSKVATKETIYFAETYNNDTEEVEDWGELNYVCMFTARTGGNLIAYQELPNPIHPGADGQASVALIRKGDLSIEIANPASDE
jgi:hypothetical protein